LLSRNLIPTEMFHGPSAKMNLFRQPSNSSRSFGRAQCGGSQPVSSPMRNCYGWTSLMKVYRLSAVGCGTGCRRQSYKSVGSTRGEQYLIKRDIMMTRRVFALFFSLTFLFCVQASAQTVDEIIKKHLEARGGVEKVKAIKSVKASGRILQQGLEIPITIQQKR